MKWTVLLVGLGVCALAFYGVVRCNDDSDVARVLESVPLGSGLSGLERVAKMRNVTRGDVMEWVQTDEAPDREDIQLRVDGAVIRTEFGVFRQRSLGPYPSWNPGPEASGFSGEVAFFLDRPFGNVVMVGFTFIDGKLVKKDWGHLPG